MESLRVSSRLLLAVSTAVVLYGPLACIPAGSGAGDDGSSEDAALPRDRGALLLDAQGLTDGAVDAVIDAAVDGAPPDLSTADAAPPAAACADGLDNDRDGRVDFPDDPGCDGPEDDDEDDPPPAPGCDDGIDNDGDGMVDAADPDCTGPLDPTEAGGNQPTACSDGADNDEDGAIDFPDDPGCVAAGHNTEADPLPLPACANGVDDDGDGIVDYPDEPGCAGRGDEDEADPVPAPMCANGIDDDGNGTTDYPDDSGCRAAGDRLEQSPCGAELPLIDLNAHLAEQPDYRGDLAGSSSRLVGSCGGAAGGELAFAYTVDGPLDALTFDTRHPETEAPVVMYLRDACRGDDRQCDRGALESPGTALSLVRPPPGRYVVVVDTGSRDVQGRFRLTVEAVEPPACRNGRDDDGDGLVDLADPGCAETEDADEVDPPAPPACANGLDDDGDGAIDYPDDVDCPAAGGVREAPPCALAAPYVVLGQTGGEIELPVSQGAGVAASQCDPAVGAEVIIVLSLSEPSAIEAQVLTAQGAQAGALFARTICEDAESEFACRPGARQEALVAQYLERGTYFLFAEQGFAAPAQPNVARVVVTSLLGACNDGVDNDADGRIDLDDPGCPDGLGESEIDPAVAPQCSDGIDNDMNGLIDYPADEGCEAAGDPEEDPDCVGEFFGDVCLVAVSEACQNGSARAWCAQNGGRVITFAEFQAVVAAGWSRPSANYHTVTVDAYAQCDGDIGNCGIPGWGDFNHWNCGDDQDYCNRAIMCVQ